MTVAVVIKRIRSATLFTFDYATYLFLASIVALLGLLENSSVVIVASMLISPIMGPILASIFGCITADKDLRNKGIKHGLISLILCVFIGFVFGFLFIAIEECFNYEVDQFITTEMIVRGSTADIVLDIGIAVASGAAAALSVLGENTSSMVGVAISASLLPPAVNAGFLWSVALTCGYFNKTMCELIDRGKILSMDNVMPIKENHIVLTITFLPIILCFN